MVRFASLIRAGVSAVRVHGGRCILPPSSRQLLPVAQRRSLFGVPEEVMPEPERRVEKVDFCVIGGGPAGWAAAARAWDLGKKTIVVESRGGLGGNVVWCGLAARVMLEYGEALSPGQGLCGTPPGSSQAGEAWTEARKRARLAMRERATQLCSQLIAMGQTRRFNRPKLKRAERSGSIQRFDGKAAFVSPNAIDVSPHGEKAGEPHVRIEAEHFLIATGSRSREYVKYKADGKRILTPFHLVRLKTLPASAVVLGAGIEGIEAAALLAKYGCSEVHLVCHGARLFAEDDDDFSAALYDALHTAGVQVHTNAKLEFAKEDDSGIECRVTRTVLGYNADGAPDRKKDVRRTFKVENLILCDGRVPNTKDLNLEAAGVDVSDQNGAILVNEHNRSISAPNICAAGDVIGGYGLSQVAEMEARVAVEQLFEPEFATKNGYEPVSVMIHICPRAAMVGMSEQEAIRRRIPHVTAMVDLNHGAVGLINKYSHPRRTFPDNPAPDGSRIGDDILAAIENEEEEADTITEPIGFVKVVVKDDDSKQLLGVRCVGKGAKGVVQAAGVLMGAKLHIAELTRVPQPQPTILGALQQAARMTLGTSIHKAHQHSTTWVRTYHPPEGEPEVELEAGKREKLVASYMDGG